MPPPVEIGGAERRQRVEAEHHALGGDDVILVDDGDGLVGVGHADKRQIQHMVARLLPGVRLSGPDAADALAVGADAYIEKGGGDALKMAASVEPANVVDALMRSGLRGRGGAGFPTHHKWQMIAAHADGDKFVICNGNEDEPGTFDFEAALYIFSGQYEPTDYHYYALVSYLMPRPMGIGRLGDELYLVMERQVKGKQFGLLFARLPSLEFLDTLNNRLVVVGFIALSITLATGAFFITGTGRGLTLLMDAKVLATLVAWGLFAAVAGARVLVGWRGRRVHDSGNASITATSVAQRPMRRRPIRAASLPVRVSC